MARTQDKQPLREQLESLARRYLDGEYQIQASRQEVEQIARRFLIGVQNNITSAVLMMTTLHPMESDKVVMSVQLMKPENRLPYIRLSYSVTVLGLLIDFYRQLGFNLDTITDIHRVLQLDPTFPLVIEHEIWHIMLGDVYNEERARRYATDPLFNLAVEIRINDGYLGSDRIAERLLPTTCLDTLGIRKEAERIATSLGYPSDWLRDEELVYEVLRQLAPQQSASMSDLIQQMVGTGLVMMDDDLTDQETTEPDGMDVEGDTLGAIQQAMSQLLKDNPNVQYDPYHNRFNYSPYGYSEQQRRLQRSALIVDWSRIHKVLGIQHGIGWNRRTGPVRPIHETPLVRTKPATRRIYAFIDSSGSVSDELISRFIGTVRSSPFPVVVKYFSTQVTDHPHTGGTRFACIEEYLRSLDRYPDTVLVLTDGEDYGPVFSISHPKRWYWIVQGTTELVTRLGGTVLPVRERVIEP